MSGVSYNGGASRCWNSWQQFINCYTAKETADPLEACKAAADNYHECLFHEKEIARANKIAGELQRRETKGDDIVKAEVRHGLKYTLTDLEYIK